MAKTDCVVSVLLGGNGCTFEIQRCCSDPFCQLTIRIRMWHNDTDPDP